MASGDGEWRRSQPRQLLPLLEVPLQEQRRPRTRNSAISAYSGERSSSSSCVPRSTIRPSSMTTISSASEIVESRWATMNVVRPCHHLAQAVLDRLLGARVDRGGRVVEDQHARLGEQRPGDRDPLTLAARERQPALADDGVVAVGSARDEVVRLRPPRGQLDLLRGSPRAGRRRCCRRPCPRTGSCHPRRTRSDVRSESTSIVAQVGAVDQDRAFGRVIEARDQRDQAGLARAGRPDERHGPPSLDVELDRRSSARLARRRSVSPTSGTRPAPGRRAAAGRLAGSSSAARGRGSRTCRLPEATARWAIPSDTPSVRIGPISITR